MVWLVCNAQKMTRSKVNPSVKKTVLWGCGLFLVAVAYYFANLWWGFSISCPFYRLTGWYCPGCGITRLLFSIMSGDFYHAFRYNPLVFILLPFGAFLVIDYLITAMKSGDASTSALTDASKDSPAALSMHQSSRKALVDRIPETFWIILVIVALLYGVIRNLPWFAFLAPTG